MTEFDFDNLTADQDDDDNTIRQLRQALKSRNKEFKELQGEVNRFKTEQRSGNVSQILKTKGYDPGVAQDIPADVEPTEEAITAWLGARPWIKPAGEMEKAPEAPGNATEDAVPNGLSAELLAQYQALQNLEQRGGIPQVAQGAEKIMAEAEEILSSKGPQALTEWMRSRNLSY